MQPKGVCMGIKILSWMLCAGLVASTFIGTTFADESSKTTSPPATDEVASPAPAPDKGKSLGEKGNPIILGKKAQLLCTTKKSSTQLNYLLSNTGSTPTGASFTILESRSSSFSLKYAAHSLECNQPLVPPVIPNDLLCAHQSNNASVRFTTTNNRVVITLTDSTGTKNFNFSPNACSFSLVQSEGL